MEKDKMLRSLFLVLCSTFFFKLFECETIHLYNSFGQTEVCLGLASLADEQNYIEKYMISILLRSLF